MARRWRGCLAPLVLLSGCRWLSTGDPAALDPVPRGSVRRVFACQMPRPCRDSLDIVSLGVGGYLFLPWRDTAQLAMTPPAFSNPSSLRVALLDYVVGTRSDPARVSAALARLQHAGPERLARVGAVLVGHGHYDHLMDLPSMAPLLPKATIHGSRTVVNLLDPVPAFASPAGGAPRLRSVDSIAGVDADHPGQWLPAGPVMRFRAVTWQHARNLPWYTFATGDVLEPRATLPWRARGWKKGRMYAYALDVLDPMGKPALRVILQDAAASPRVAARAAGVWRLDPAEATVLLISAANFDAVRDYPDTLLTLLRPDHVVFGHWEHFFGSPMERPRVVRGIDAKALVQRVDAAGTPWSAIEPGGVLRVLF